VKFSNEIKVGITIIAATAIFILGVRYFEDLPLFNSTYDLAVEFNNAGGLIAGNIVRVNGVAVGSVGDVFISEETGKVIAQFHVDRGIPVTEGSYAKVAGFDALGVVRLDLFLGPSDAPRVPEGGYVEGRSAGDLMADLSASAPDMIEGVDEVLDQLGGVLTEANTLLATPESELRQTLQAAQGSVEQIESLLRDERDRIAGILANIDSVTSDLDNAMGPEGAAVSELMDTLNATLDTLNEDLERFGETNDQLQDVLRKINEGEGTLGLLINDDSMYHRMDSTLSALNSLMADFQENPGRYLKEMKLVDLF